jgi:hypothetical protein
MNNQFLNQVAQFIKIAIDKEAKLEEQILQQKKAALVEELNKEKYRIALNKVADVLYDSDYLVSENERKQFIKKSNEDPVYVIRTLEKVCNSNDVSFLGKAARVSNKVRTAGEDPVYDAAFGMVSGGIMDDE